SVLRQGNAASSDALIQSVALRLRDGYSQVPQHEGRPLALSLLARTPAPNVLVPAPLPVTDAVPLSPQQMVYEGHLRFLETMRELEGLDPAQPRQTRTGARVLVAVHGIGKHPDGFSDPWWHSLKPQVGGLFQPGTLGQGRAEVRWSDLV
ncbi:MAG: hypothetical protein ACK53L_22420, partial [Pirellulaceae bacterium]